MNMNKPIQGVIFLQSNREDVYYMKCEICDEQYSDYPPFGPWRKQGLCKECKERKDLKRQEYPSKTVGML
jgi:hypothetical protein